MRAAYTLHCQMYVSVLLKYAAWSTRMDGTFPERVIEGVKKKARAGAEAGVADG